MKNFKQIAFKTSSFNNIIVPPSFSIYELNTAPNGGCTVTYYNQFESLATENIPSQDAGLSFTINVGTGGIVSDTCGFVLLTS